MALRNTHPSAPGTLEHRIDAVLDAAGIEDASVETAHEKVDAWLEQDRRFHRRELARV